MKKTLIGALGGIALSALVFGVLCVTNIITFKNNNNENNNKEEFNNNTITSHIEKIDPVDFLTSEELTQNFKNLIKNEAGWKLTFSCIEYNDEEKRCEGTNVTINDVIEFDSDLVTCGGVQIIQSDKYYIKESIIGCGIDRFDITIYSKDGKKLYEEQNGTSYINSSYVEDNIYHYNTYEEIDDNHDKLFYKLIDLNKNEITSKNIRNKIVEKLPQIG